MFIFFQLRQSLISTKLLIDTTYLAKLNKHKNIVLKIFFRIKKVWGNN
jgi:hypothetical protein